MIAVSMAMHHVAGLDRVFRAFHQMLRPGGILCIADLDTEPGTFHRLEEADSVHHYGFDRENLKSQLAAVGFRGAEDTTVVTFKKPVADGREEEFSVFLIRLE
jgi:predicted methyltransferase